MILLNQEQNQPSAIMEIVYKASEAAPFIGQEEMKVNLFEEY